MFIHAKRLACTEYAIIWKRKQLHAIERRSRGTSTCPHSSRCSNIRIRKRMKFKFSNNNKITIHLRVFPWVNCRERERERKRRKENVVLQSKYGTRYSCMYWSRSPALFPFKTTWQIYHDSITVVIENVSFIVLSFVLHHYFYHFYSSNIHLSISICIIKQLTANYQTRFVAYDDSAD